MIATLFAVVGAGVSIASGILWNRYKVFHLAPWLYGAVGDALVQYLYHRIDAIDFVKLLVPGGVFYAMAWLSTIETRKRFGL
jgi:hypothetical protein